MRIASPVRRSRGQACTTCPEHTVLTNQRLGAEAPEESLAQDIDSSATNSPDRAAASPARSRRIARATVARRPAPRPIERERALERTAPARTAKHKNKPLRSLVILAMVGGLVATVALPAYGAFRPAAQALTLQQVAADNAQSLVVASDVAGAALTRDSYSATTAEDIAKKKAEEAAAARARELAASTASSSSSSSRTSTNLSNVDLSMVAPGSGEVRWPISDFKLGQRLGAGRNHQGVDFIAPAMTPIFAVAAGVVSVSQESYGGYGVGVAIDHVIGGQRVGSIYGHMTYGTRQVSAGQTVEAGQLIGFVGSTGRSTTNHLHLEIRINGGVVDGYSWLEANAG